jgi:hypothetical protein
VRRVRFGVDLAVSVAATLYIVMYAVYTYVDVSWDPRNTVFLGLALAIVGGSIAPTDERADDADDDAVPDEQDVPVVDEPPPAGRSVRRVDDPVDDGAFVGSSY